MTRAFTSTEDYLDLLRVARGEAPADLILRGAQVLNTLTGEFITADVAIAGEHIAGVGQGHSAKEIIDLDGRFLIPGLIDTHVHIESSLCTPEQYARAVLPHGVTTVVADPHEMANVAGQAAVRYLIEATEGLPLTVFCTLPSCVPATRMGTSGAELTLEDLIDLASLPRVLGLGEMMDVHGTVLGKTGTVEKLFAFQELHIDGHAPGIAGPWLQAYIAAGPETDHECTTREEAREKVRLGLYVLMREGTGAKNLRALLRAVTPENAHRFAFATDDRNPRDLVEHGSIDNHIRKAVRLGLEPVTAIQMATVNGANAMGIRDRGAIAPGRRADLIVCQSLEKFEAEIVFAGGVAVAQDGKLLPLDWPDPVPPPAALQQSIHVNLQDLSFRIPDEGTWIRAIQLVPEQLATLERIVPATVSEDGAQSDANRDLLKLAVIERHRGTGNVGLGFVDGFGIRHGAIGSSIGHDCHNIVVAGVEDEDLILAVQAICEMHGGLVVVRNGAVRAALPLPVGGLMSDLPVDEINRQLEILHSEAADLGCKPPDPFMPLSFLSLEVLPKLRLTDQGLVDAEEFDFVPLWYK